MRHIANGFIAVMATIDAFMILHCADMPAAKPPAPLPLWDGGSGCLAACDRRSALGCLEESLRDVCVPVCERATARGLYSPACVLSATSREEMTARCRVRCGR